MDERQKRFKEEIEKGERLFIESQKGNNSYGQTYHLKPVKKKYNIKNFILAPVIIVILILIIYSTQNYLPFSKSSLVKNINSLSTLSLESKQEQVHNKLDDLEEERKSMASVVNEIVNSYSGKTNISQEYADSLKTKTFTDKDCPNNLKDLSPYIDNINNQVLIINELIDLRLSNFKNTNNDIAKLNALIDNYNKLVKIETTLLIEALDKFNMHHVTQNDGQIRYWYEK